jgi:hypothetical protein
VDIRDACLVDTEANLQSMPLYWALCYGARLFADDIPFSIRSADGGEIALYDGLRLNCPDPSLQPLIEEIARASSGDARPS